LPHEVEWEMAARGTDERCYAFPEILDDIGRNALRAAGPRSVGNNPHDKSPFGVLDMTGNVGELTMTVYDPLLLHKLHQRQKEGAFKGWDPRDPFMIEGLLAPLPSDPRKSCTVAVRGGAWAEREVFCQVSVRRQQEYSTPDLKVGFRLLLVRKDPL
ncbi:MAG: SUMF1/EgtB/PvdO family nonheme iron enzyme, partial [Planctomycetes bacterium]|nr:SUMF1/EgtB/PvdO family nonheme iron enzyme [Planctomycetota bacterium]